MSWTMPPRVLQIVAGLLVLVSATAFVLGIVGAPQRGGRLPGQKVPGLAQGVGAAIDAEDATPLVDARIQGAPPPAANDQAKDDDKQTEADAGNSDDDEDANTAPPPPASTNAQAPAAAPPNGNAPPPQTLGGPPAPDEPPH